MRAKSENKIQEEKIRNQNEKNEFLNSVSHEICAGLENGGYTDIRVRNLKALLLLADQPIDKKYVELKSLVEDLVNEYSLNSKFNLIFEYPETLTVSDQPLGLILTNLITNCSKNNAFGKAQLSTYIDAQSLIFKLRNNVGKICSQGKIERFHKQTNRTGLSLVRKSLAFLGIGIENLHIVPTDRYTDVVVKIPLNSVAIEDDASRLPIETRVAIIDDDKGYRDSLFERLQSLGIEPTPYSHVDYFYDDVVAGKIFDIAIVDRHGDQLESPDMDEWDAVKHNFCNSARKYGYKGKIILFSNAAVGAQGFDEILSKEVYNDWGNIISRVLQSK